MPQQSLKLLCLLLPILLPSVSAAEFSTTASDQQDLNLTIYNGGRALIRESRQFNVGEKTRHIAFIDVAQTIMPQTVAITGLDVQEQNYDFDLLSPQALIEKNIGNKIRIARRSSISGETLQWIEGRILSNNGGVILQMDDGRLERLDSNQSYHMVFDQVPDNLRSRPTLSLTLYEKISGPQQIDITYLSTGLQWQNDYVLQLDTDETQGSLDSWVTLQNNSGISYQNAHLQLLAGDVNIVAAQPEVMMMADAMAPRMSQKRQVKQEALHGYHLYSVPHKTTLSNRQSKQIKLLSAHQVPLKKRLEDKAWVDRHGLNKASSKPDQILILNNNKPALGIPLPMGTVRVYGKDSEGGNQFVGEDRIGHTAVNDEVEIKLGKAFDISIDRQTIDSRQISKKQLQLTRLIKINNGSDKPQQLELSELMPTTNWRISSSTLPHKKSSPQQALFNVALPAMSKTEIQYSVQITYP